MREDAPTNCLFRLFYSFSLCEDCGGYCKSEHEEEKPLYFPSDNPGEIPCLLALVA